MLVTSYKPMPRNIQGEQRPQDFALSPGYYEQSLALYQCDRIEHFTDASASEVGIFLFSQFNRNQNC
jgi:hypothetical protein